MEILIIILITFAVAFEAAADKIAQHFSSSIFSEFKNKKFWDPSISWKNKYMDYDNGDKRERFPGSKTVFVGFTDGWHMMKSGMLLCIYIALTIATVWWMFPALCLVHLFVFEYLYKKEYSK